MKISPIKPPKEIPKVNQLKEAGLLVGLGGIFMVKLVCSKRWQASTDATFTKCTDIQGCI